jgi:transposase
VLLTAANVNDVTQLQPLVEAIPPVRGKPGRPRHRPEIVQGDRGYDSQEHRNWLRQRGIQPLLAKRGEPHGSRLGKTRWVVERTLAWLHHFRRLRIRWERRDDIHLAFLKIGCALIAFNFLQQGFC